MMYTTYTSTTSSSIISLLRNYSTFNDYSYCSLNNKHPSIYCSCCCSFPVNSCKLIVPTTNPSILYGLRQSTLIQCPPSRRFLSGSGDRYCCRSLNYDVGQCSCSEFRCVKVERVGGCICNEKCGVKEKRGVDVGKDKRGMGRGKRDFRRNAVGDVEAMLSLLSEVSIEECGVVKKKRSSLGEGRVVSKPSDVIEKYKDRKPNVVVEKLKDRKPNDVIEKYKDRKPNVGLRWESEPKNHRLESKGRVQARNEGYKRNEERERVSKDEYQRLRRREFSPSYCSLSDSGGSESDVEVEIERDQFVGDSSTGHKKDSRKSGGVVISELTEQDWERYKGKKDQVLRSSKRDDLKVGSSIPLDWRKKSEKKLTEDSVETNSKNIRQSQLSQAQQRTSMIASSSKSQLNYQKEQSTSNVASLGQSSTRILKDNRTSKYSKSSSQHERSTQKNTENVESTSTIWRRSRQGEDSKIIDNSVQDTGCEYCKTCGRNTENSKLHIDLQRHAEPIKMSIDANFTTSAGSLSENRHKKHENMLSSNQSSVEEESTRHDQSLVVAGLDNAERKSQHRLETVSTDDVRAQSTLRETRISEAQNRYLVEKSKTTAESQSESRLRKEEKSSILHQTSAKEENNQHDEIYLEATQVDARRKVRHHHGMMDTDATYSQNTLRSQQQSETRMKHLEEKTASIIAVEEVKRLRGESGDKGTKDIESSNVSHSIIGDSGIHSSNLDISNHSTSDKSVYHDQTYSKSNMKSVEELVEKRKPIDETIVQSTLRTEVQEPSTRHFPGAISQPSLPLSQTGVQQISGEKVTSGQLLITSPPYQDVSRSQFHVASSSSVRNDMGLVMESGFSSSHKHSQAITPSYGEVYDRGTTMFGEEYTPEDVLLSAARMQESSELIVGEFLETMKVEASTSEATTAKNLAKLDSKQHDTKYKLNGSIESDSDRTGSQRQDLEHRYRPDSEKKKSQKLDSKLSSSDSGTKGSSDQMWDVKDHFAHEASEMESLEGATSESVAVVRTGKSLWSVVAGVLRWGSRSSNQKSPVKGKTSPSGSAVGESWFSGNEEDGSNGDDTKAEQLMLLQETSSDQSLLRASKSRKDDVVGLNLDAKLSHVDVGTSSSSGVLHSSSLSGGAIVGENTNLNVPQHFSLPSSPVDLSIPSAGQLRRTHGFEEIDGAEKIEVPLSPSEAQRNYAANVRRTDESAYEETDAEMNKRKLQRSKVVLQRFDEWEDAYKRDREQRKVDEIFMREALLEAMKAADSWEVPVGAILVQNGKIIARGYNLVEELRDSTAHAEMLCIREASNVLRTWRLSETTLYVTLEPCPMCAGAILQARIGTLVWGAPNKLLGADGSWIRLFPVDVEGEQHSEVTDKSAAAPVHPFHPKMKIRRGILQEECSDIMQQFFQLKRRKAKEKVQKNTLSSDESSQPSCFPKPHHRSRLLHKMHNVFHPPKQ